MTTEFKVGITLGNVDMSHPYNIGRALREVADRVDAVGRAGRDVAEIEGLVRDVNGNTVGAYGVTST